jgi:hypothetical protein
MYLYFADNRSARRKGAIPLFQHHGRETIGDTTSYSTPTHHRVVDAASRCRSGVERADNGAYHGQDALRALRRVYSLPDAT